ncbi:hypothetical protein DSO57_1009081 [Entomophthora muscae]|uniref:Uncharacterized protein n=1 Tax=Entomophthora muscae TaxID=34485 RepID=A0ACC2S979_9FUNG|nr:hypothetical protein DSO57_1009081 [Entomophthora muscae]
MNSFSKIATAAIMASAVIAGGSGGSGGSSAASGASSNSSGASNSTSPSPSSGSVRTHTAGLTLVALTILPAYLI